MASWAKDLNDDEGEHAHKENEAPAQLQQKVVARASYGQVWRLSDYKGCQAKVVSEFEGPTKMWLMVGRLGASVDSNGEPRICVTEPTALYKPQMTYLHPEEFGRLLGQQEEIRADLLKTKACEKERLCESDAQRQLAMKILKEQGGGSGGGCGFNGGNNYKRFKRFF